MTLAAPLPWFVVLPIVAAVAGLAWRATRGAGLRPSGRLVLASLRVAAAILLLLLYMRPVRVGPDDTATRPVVAVLVDASSSMDLAGVSGASRFEEGLRLARDQIAPALSEMFVTELWTFGDRIDRVPDRASGSPVRTTRSDMATALTAIAEQYASRRLAGLVVVSDGAVTPPREATLAAWTTPVFTFGTGPVAVSRDDEVVSVSLGETHISDAAVDLTATVRRRGDADEPLEVRLFENDRAIGLVTVSAREGTAARVVFRVTPSPDAVTRYTVSLAERPGELTPQNNAASVLASPAGRVRRVLMVEGAPGFEHSFLKRSWDQDRAVLIDSVVRKGQNDQGRDTWYVQASGDRAGALAAGFPVARDALFAYDALVVANFDASSLSRDQLAMFEEFVTTRGGGLLVVGSRAFEARAVMGTPLERLLPIEVSSRRGVDPEAGVAGRGASVDLTSDGRLHPILRVAGNESETMAEWARAPRLAGGVDVGGPRPGATVLAFMTSPTGVRPLVSTQRVGAGRVVAFTGEAAFRWKMMRPSDDRLYDAFWRQTLRWVAAPATAPVAVTTPPEAHGSISGAVVVRNARFEPVRDAEVTVELVPAEGEPLRITPAPSDAGPGRYEFSVPWSTPGPVRLEVSARQGARDLGRDEAWVLSDPAAGEFADPRQQADGLARLAAATGGSLLREGDIGSLASRFASADRTRRRLTEIDAWHTPWLWFAVLTVLAGEWALRRRWGLR